MLEAVLPSTARVFGRAIVMPNLPSPIRTVADAEAYRARILKALPSGVPFDPLMTLYLTARTEVKDVQEAVEHPHVHAIKLYPAGATTHAQAGVTDLDALSPVFEAMQRHALPLLIHGESIDPHDDVFDREERFITTVLEPLCSRFPELRIVLEHITTEQAVKFIEGARSPIAATITAHHLLLNRNAIFRGGLRPHAYCLPVLKRERHRQALLAAATSGNARFFLGTDSAPHPRSAKESDCGCAGIFTAPAALELYAEAFASVDALDRLEGFASRFGAEFYGLAPHEDTVVLQAQDTPGPELVEVGSEVVVPMRAGETLSWRIVAGTR